MKLTKYGYEIEATPEEVHELMKLEELSTMASVKVLQVKAADNELKDPEEPKKKTAKVNSTKKDIGKIKALRNAGWTIAKIADEFGVSAQTIRNWIQEGNND